MERTKLGQFIKGKRYSQATEFKKGTHWRKEKPFWHKEWLENEYTNKKRTAEDIASEFSIMPQAIFFWLKKYGIKRRTMSEARKIKYWGLSGKQNGMYGKTGKQSPHWNGGHSPERQSAYARFAWKELAKTILRRDNYHCKKCGEPNRYKNRLVVHHKKPWAKYPRYRFVPSNLITVCELCHKEIHKKKIGGWLIP